MKIQELEEEIARLRSEIESQSFKIKKLEEDLVGSNSTNSEYPNQNVNTRNNDGFKFEGLNDQRSLDEIYDNALKNLNNKNYSDSYNEFKFIVDNFDDPDKVPLSAFWMAEISMNNNDLEDALFNFLFITTSFPDHWRIPLAHKKIGDIYLVQNRVREAESKYRFVVSKYPSSPAASLALQILENME
ncbi:MAG: tol-pal system protein [Gammaproteobacteria bacterium]